MLPVITAFAQSPDRGRGQARDMRVRWALEEVGQPYDVELVTFEEMKAAPYRARQPFGQIPTFREGELILFESGAILHHIATTRAGLLPETDPGRARAIMWMFAALSTLEPVILERETAVLLERDEPWHESRLPRLDARVEKRLSELAAALGDRDWLEDGFTAGDLMMVSVLRRLKTSGLLSRFPALEAYVARGEARPAFIRAFAAQKAVFDALAARG